ncbi:hypothetical protein K439DRAFT_1613668 [Ramaria rubella]|nr:hypothetical protein K439DRAFT_1613668 [Ramaria rubella]
MVLSILCGSSQDDLHLKHDLEAAAGRPENTRARLQHFVFARKRCIIFNACVVFIFVVLVMAGFRYMERREVYGIQLPLLSFSHDDSAAYDPSRPLPRHSRYIVFEPPASPNPSLKPTVDRPLRAPLKLPEHCLESYFSLGYPCFSPKHPSFDIVWTWVNGSDPRLQEAMKEAAPMKAAKNGQGGADALATSSPDSKLYRDHDELRHSFRSVLQHFRQFIDQFHLVTSDFPFSADQYTQFDPPAGEPLESTTPAHRVARVSDAAEAKAKEDDIHDGGDVSHVEQPLTTANRTLRLGQLPSWLHPNEQYRWTDGNVKIKVTHQAQIFQNYTGTSFNSYSIESQLHNLADIEQNFIYLNDDFFFARDLQPADFYTSGNKNLELDLICPALAYGTVIRLDPTLLVKPVPANSKENPAGEWGPLGYSSWLLSERFGSRPRPYPIHAAKSFSMPLLDEVAHIWEDELRATAAHKFRGMKDPETGAGDAYMSFLLTHMVVERWREALLWSWVVGRIGGDEDEWGAKEQALAWEELGGDPDNVGRNVPVKMTVRKTVEKDRIASTLKASGQTFSEKTSYTFCEDQFWYSSTDGYPYSYANRQGRMAWPAFSGLSIGQSLCNLNFDKCIGGASSASEAFKKIAFENPVQCGDCIIAALRSASGVLGLSAFLPPRARKTQTSLSSSFLSDLLHFDVSSGAEDGSDDDEDPDKEDTEPEAPLIPHLPLVKNWVGGNFSLQAVLDQYGPVNVREWTLRLLERYRFVIGDTNIIFLMVEGPYSARTGLNRVTKDVSLLCMNDDVRTQFQATDRIIRDWESRRWPRPAQWERER